MKLNRHAQNWLGLPLTLLCALGVAGCSSDDGEATGDDDSPVDSPTPDPTPSSTPTPTPTLPPSPTPTATPVPNPLDIAVAAVGGADRLSTLNTLQLEAHGDRLEFAEGYAPGDSVEEVSSFELKVDQDLSSDELRLDWTRTIQVLWYGGTDYTETLSGDQGLVQGYDWYFGSVSGNQGVMNSARVAMVKRQHRLFNPDALLKAAAANPESTVTLPDETLGDTTYHVLELTDDVAPLKLYIHPSTGLIERLLTYEADHTLGDVELEINYSNWKEAGDSGLLFPFSVTLLLDGMPLQEEIRDNITVNPSLDASLFSAAQNLDGTVDEALAQRGANFAQWTQRFIAIGLPLDFVDTYVTPVEITTTEVPSNSGVWQLVGASHHSFVVEQADGLVVVEAPLYEEKSQALISTMRNQWPDKPIRYVVATHWHTDHVGGLRAFAAEGATIVVGASTRDFYERILSAPHQLVPDALESNPVEPTILTVPNGTNGDRLLLGEGDRNAVEVTHISVDHATDMAIIQTPSLGLSINGDLYNPVSGGATSPLTSPYSINAPQLYEAMEDAEINAKYLGAIHSTAIRPYNDLLTHVGARVELPGDNLYPEGIAADSNGDLYIGSTGTGEIFKVTPALPPATTLVHSNGDGMSTIGLLLDEPHGLLYAAYTHFTTGAAELRVFDMESGEKLRSIPVELGGSVHLANDMVLDENGNLYLTDSYAQVILRLPVGSDAFEIWSDEEIYKADGEITLNGIVIREGSIYATNAHSGDIYRVDIKADGSADAPVVLTLDSSIPGGDGMEVLDNGNLLVVSAAVGIVEVALTADAGSVTPVADGFRFPTTAVMVGSEGWVVESQFDCLYGYCTATKPFGAMRFER